MPERIQALVDQRIALERRLQNEKGELSDSRTAEYDRDYGSIQRQLAAVFKDVTDERERIRIMLEMMRILENRLVYLQNFVVEPSSENKVLAQLVSRFIDQLSRDRSTILTKLESTYYRAVAALHAGDASGARAGFAEACESEESDEANDIKYKSYVMLGHLSHEERDYAKAKEMHDQSMRYSSNNNVTAQALAFKALNAYALRDHDEALKLFREAIGLFDADQPYFNSYFYRNALLFCGSILFDRRDYKEAETYYRNVLETVEQNSYDFFDALTHLGRIYYLLERYDDAIAAFERAVKSHRFNENEYLVDTWFWTARTYLKRNDPDHARVYLEKVAATDVKYDKKPQAVDLLRKVS
jgi:tetratricopeptide (TPR) repeat protein